MVDIVFMSAVLDSWLISTMAITAPTPMIMPNVVRADRILLRRSALTAVRTVVGRIAASRPRRVFQRAVGVRFQLSVSLLFRSASKVAVQRLAVEYRHFCRLRADGGEHCSGGHR